MTIDEQVVLDMLDGINCHFFGSASKCAVCEKSSMARCYFEYKGMKVPEVSVFYFCAEDRKKYTFDVKTPITEYL